MPKADWDSVRKSLEGALIRPDDHDYLTASALFNRRFDDVRPAAIARVAGAIDVVECLSFARANNVQVSIRSGGHSYQGWSTRADHLVIDVRGIAHVDVDGLTARVGAGATLGAVYERLATHGLGIPAGTCPSVGISGLTLGGGHGASSRAFGLTCDNLVAATVVCANGTEFTCSAEHERELFWALRGAGAGTFGVVTELTFAAQRVDSVVTAEIRWPWSDAARALSVWQEWGPDLPDEIWSALRINRSAEGEFAVYCSAMSLGTQADLQRAVDQLVTATPSTTTITPQSWIDAMREYAGTDETRHSYDTRSAFIEESISADGVQTLLELAEKAPLGIEVTSAFTALGGAINRVDAFATAFVHRHYRMLAQYEAYWTDAAAEKSASTWLGHIQSAMRPHSSVAMYQNCPDPYRSDYLTAYYGAAVPRLKTLKNRLDPDRVLPHPHGL